MDKGIRPFAIAKFLELLPHRVNTRQGNTKFRKEVIATLEESFGITHASGATHYNAAFIKVREMAETNGVLKVLLTGLGRPEDKKGGRKPKATNVVVATALTAAEVEGNNEDNEDTNLTPDLGAPQEFFSVKKKSDGTVVAENLSFEAAKALVEKAAMAKKAKLYWC